MIYGESKNQPKKTLMVHKNKGSETLIYELKVIRERFTAPAFSKNVGTNILLWASSGV